jgi:dolichol-phosphate mannosyltransferase
MKIIKDLNIIIPLRDEENQIKITIDLLNKELKSFKKNFIITLVDDHSRDGTWNLLEKIKQENNKIEIFKNEYLPGYGNAVRFGIEKNESDAVVFFMGDCSDNPKDIISYIDYLDQGFDCVFGSRFIKNSVVEDYPLLKLILNRIANNFIRLLFLIKYNDVTNAFKAYRKDLLVDFKPIVSNHFNINAELALKAISRGYKYKVIPISWSNRKKNISKFKIKEMQNRYIFTILYVWIEKMLLQRDLKKD